MKKIFYISIIIYFIYFPVKVLGSNITVICAPGSLGDYSPFTSVPMYDYGQDGYVRFHFTLDGSGWNFSNNYFYHYSSDCQFTHMSSYTFDSQGSVPIGVTHLLLKVAPVAPGSPWFSLQAFNEDTGTEVGIGPLPAQFSDPILSVGIIKTAGYYGYPGYREDGARTPAVPIKDPSRTLITKTPVLIIPGVLGTDIKKGDELLWANLGEMASDNGDKFMDPIQFNNNLSPSDDGLTIADLVKNPLLGQHFYDLIIKEFQDQNYTFGSTQIDTLFTFSYDWRYGVSGVVNFSTGSTTVDLLKSKIDEIRKQTGSDKVDVVAHSTGGLLLKKYVMDHQADSHIGKAVFVGVPNTGASKAIKTLLEGDNFDIPWLADSEMKKIAQNLPVVYDLMPSGKYYTEKMSPVKVLSGKNFTTSQKELNYSETNDYLQNSKGLNTQAITNAKNLHTIAFDTYDLRTAGVDLYNIAGCKTGTISQILDFQHDDGGHVRYDLADDVPGDGTVPLESATNLPVDPAHKYFALKANHGKMLSQEGIRQEIVNIIAGSNLPVSSKDMSQDISKCKLKGRAISVYSPLDISITDQDGNNADFSSGSIQNLIPNADFEIMGEHKFVYLPTDDNQVYSIHIKGTGNGSFTLKDENILDNQILQTQVFSNLPVTTSLSGSVNLGSTTTLSLDINNDGVTDKTILPSSVISSDQSQDLTPPVSTTTVAGTLLVPGLYSTSAAVVFKVQDPVIPGKESQTSGILKVSYNIDGGAFQDVPLTSAPSSFVSLATTSPIVVKTPGSHTITFFSTDRAGNNEPMQTMSFGVTSGTDITSKVSVTQNGFGKNRATGLWSATLTLTNTSPAALTGPIQVLFTSLTPGVTMTNNTSSIGTIPYITMTSQSLLKGTSVSSTIQFSNPSGGFINFVPVVIGGGL